MTIPGVQRALYRYVRPFRWRLIPVFLACLLEMGLTAQLPLSIKYLIDRALGHKDSRALVIILTALAISAVVVSAAGLGRDHLYARMYDKRSRSRWNFIRAANRATSWRDSRTT